MVLLVMNKKEVALTIITEGKRTNEVIEVNPEFVEYGIKAFGIRVGHELGGNLVGTKATPNGYEVREYTCTSEEALLNGDCDEGKLLATIKVA